jgi:hypothetical protein
VRCTQIDCYQTVTSTKTGGLVNNVVSTIDDLHFLALHNLAEIQLGADLLFWFHYTQALKRIVFKDQYIPALTYRELIAPKASQAKGKSAKPVDKTTTRGRQAKSKKQTATSQTIDVSAKLFPKSSTVEIYPSWEFIGEEYETTIQQYVEYMPLVCVAGVNKPRETPEFYDRTTLLRHFSESLLINILTHLPTTQAFEKTIADSLVYDCLHGSGKVAKTSLEQFKQWQTWRDRIDRTQSKQSFHLYGSAIL